VKTRNLSADGNRVFFETPDQLVSTDVNGVSDVYEWEADGTGSCQSDRQDGGCLYLLSTGTSPLPSRFADASASGNDVFIFTAQSLVRQDRDELVDVYDVRVGGGIPSQEQVEPEPCEGENCKGSVLQPPAPAGPGSNGTGPGNPKPLACKKGFKRATKHGREVCVKKAKHKKGKSHKKQRKSSHKKSPGQAKGRVHR
jgi:hypothetical protein